MAYDVELFAGDSLDISCAVKDPGGAAVDLAGAEAVYSVSKSVKDIALITKSSTVSGEIDLTLGNMTVHLRSGDTQGVVPGSYYHEAQITLADGRVGTPLTGKFKLKENLIAPR